MSFVQLLQDSWNNTGFNASLDQINHGNLQNWLTPLERLPTLSSIATNLGKSIQITTDADLSPHDRKSVKTAVNALIPWRKGPFTLFGIEVDSEWRSDLKWQRISDHVNLSSKRVLDVGSGNGYFGYRMLAAGAKSVTGLDSSLLPVLQAALVNHFAKLGNVVVPMRFGLEPLPREYDVVFSMGVIYHQRNQEAHISALYKSLGEGGFVVLESIIADSPIYPRCRYAGMRNLSCIPSLKTLADALSNQNFSDVRVVNVTKTTSIEQRTTEYMPFKSLQDFLSKTDPQFTIEGYPAPQRAVILAQKC